MSLRDRIQNALKGFNQSAPAETIDLKSLENMIYSNSTYTGLDAYMMPRSNFDYAKEVAPMLNSAVSACVHWFMRTFPEAPIIIKSTDADGNQVLDNTHEAVKRLAEPNPYYSGSLLMMGVISDYLTTGNGYIMKLRNNTSSVTELWYTSAALIQPQVKKGSTEYITHYDYRPHGSAIEIAPEDVIHLRFGIDQNNVRKGLSPLAVVLEERWTDDEAANYSASLLKNMGVAGLFMTPKEVTSGLSREGAETLKSKFKERFTGDRRGEPFISNMPLDITKLSFSPSEMNLRDVRRIPEERVAAVLGIPAIVAGLGAGLDRATFANFAEAREMAYESGVIPLQRLIATDLTTQYLREFDSNPNLQIAFDNRDIRVLQEDEVAQATKVGSLYKGGVITRAEARQQVGLPFEDNDNIFLAPTNVNEVERNERAPLAGAGGGDSQLMMDASSLDLSAKIRDGVSFHSVVPSEIQRKNWEFILKQEPELTRRQFERQLEKDLIELETLFSNELSKEFELQATELSKAYLKHVLKDFNIDDELFDSDLDIEIKDIAITGNIGEEDLDMLVDTLLTSPGLMEPSRQRIELIYQRAFRRTATKTFPAVAGRIGAGIVFNEQDTIGRTILETGGRRAGLIDFSAQAKRATREAIAAGREAGDNPRVIARRIKKLVPVGRFTRMAEAKGEDAAKRYRANMIARTETHHAQRVSTVSGYRASGLVELVRAIDGKYGDTDDVCMDRDGKIFTLEDAEVETTLEHPNGTLDWEPIVQSPADPGLPLNLSANDNDISYKNENHIHIMNSLKYFKENSLSEIPQTINNKPAAVIMGIKNDDHLPDVHAYLFPVKEWDKQEIKNFIKDFNKKEKIRNNAKE